MSDHISSKDITGQATAFAECCMSCYALLP